MHLNSGLALAFIVFKEDPGGPQHLQFLSQLHWLVDLMMLIGLFFFCRSLYVKYREVNQYLWEEEPTGMAKSSWKPLLLNSGTALLLLWLLPNLAALSWKEMAEWQPTATYLLLLALLLSFFSGIFLAYVRFSHRLKLQYKEKTTAD